MRQKKSKTFLYVIILVVLGALVFVASRSLSVDTTRVEKPLANDFLNNR